MKLVVTGLFVACGLFAAGLAYVYFGIFNVAADEPHSALVYSVMDTVRSRSIAARARDIQVPALEDAKLIETGARHYAEMCSDCHLAPGKSESEIRAGLYPQPPDLTRHLHANPAEAFWVIKHGIKMSGMPAWGATHDDSSIWGLVAFLQKLPETTPGQYRKLLSRKVESHQHHEHADEESHS